MSTSLKKNRKIPLWSSLLLAALGVAPGVAPAIASTSAVSPSTPSTKTLPVTDLAHRYRDAQLKHGATTRYFSKPIVDEQLVALIRNDPSVSHKVAESTYMLLSGHLSYAKDTQLSSEVDFSDRVARKFLSSLDPAYVFFTPTDVARFVSQKDSIWQALQGQNFSWVNEVTQLYKERLKEKRNLAEQVSCFVNGRNVYEGVFYEEPKTWEVGKFELFACHQIVSRMVSGTLSPSSGQAVDWVKPTHEWKASFAQNVQGALRLSDQEFLGMFLQSYAFTVDPHSMYLLPSDKSSFQQQLNKSYEGIGIGWAVRENEVVVTSVYDGSSASKAGLLPGDRLLGLIVQGKEKALSPEDDIASLFDQAGSRFGLKFKRGNQEARVALVEKTKINLTNALAQAKTLNVNNQKILLLTVPLFYQDVSDPARLGGSVSKDLKRLIENHTRESSIDLVVLDLRGNGGGVLSEASGVLGLFMSEGVTTQLKTSSSKAHVLPITPNMTAWSGPLVVLVDKASASASEIVSASLQDHRRALIVGQPTYGKGTAQTLFDMDALSGLPRSVFGQINLTTMVFHRPNGAPIQSQGVVPDVSLARSPSVYGENTFGHMIENTTQEANLTQDKTASWSSRVPSVRSKVLQSIKNEKWYALWEAQQRNEVPSAWSLSPQNRALVFAEQKQKNTALAWMLSEEEIENPVFEGDVVLQYGIQAGQAVFFGL